MEFVMDLQQRVNQQRQKEDRSLKVFIGTSLMGSLACHALALSLPVADFWSQHSTAETIDEIEIQITDLPPEETIVEPETLIPEEAVAEIISEVSLAPEPLPLAPDHSILESLGEDAPSSEPAALTSDPLAATTSATGDIPVTGSATGPITDPNGTGSGFGNNDRPTGFARNGTSTGTPTGSTPGGTSTGGAGGGTGVKPTDARLTPSPSPSASPPPSSPELICISCPKPEYQGSEASPRVDLNIRADGTVEVRLRESSGNPDLDRATLEAMSQWRFDPETVPKEGVRKRVRVTYEEEGSRFQRENEQRRREEADRQHKLEQQREEELAQQEADRQRLSVDQPLADPAEIPAAENFPNVSPEKTLDPAVIPVTEPIVEPSIEEAPTPEIIPEETPHPPVEEVAPEPILEEAPPPIEAPAPEG